MTQRLAPLCTVCHAEKTANAPRTLALNYLASHFEKSVYDKYVGSERPPPLVYKLKECAEELQHCEIADVIKCRRRALEFNRHDVPIFCPLDEIEEVHDSTLGDINYVSKPQRANSNNLELGYTGPGWQHRCLTEFLLHHGVISWQHVTHRITATSRYPPHIFREPLQMLDEAWRNARYPQLAKLFVNSLMG